MIADTFRIIVVGGGICGLVSVSPNIGSLLIARDADLYH
jgi:hypothetical protein